MKKYDYREMPDVNWEQIEEYPIEELVVSDTPIIFIHYLNICGNMYTDGVFYHYFPTERPGYYRVFDTDGVDFNRCRKRIDSGIKPLTRTKMLRLTEETYEEYERYRIALNIDEEEILEYMEK